MNKRTISMILAIWCAASAAAQSLPQNCFTLPMKTDVALSATFAEFRANHFHGGLDMRVGGEIGVPVYAVADGYVSRISISPWGGGKVLFIKHDNGYTSVYMHLNDFAGAIGTWVKERQYDLHAYAFTEDVPEGLIPVRQGQLVAHSGNTGGSAGPHLHFEIRHPESGKLINPLLFGLPYRDGIAPTIRGIRIYPSDAVSTVNGSREPVMLAGDTVLVGGSCYLGVYATDAAEGSTKKNGYDHMEISVDGHPFFKYTTEAFKNDSTRVANALIDWKHYGNTREAYLLTRGLQGIEGQWVPMRKNNGHLEFDVGSKHSVTVKVYDLKGNMTERTFYVRSVPPANLPMRSDVIHGEEVIYSKAYRHVGNTLRVDMEAKTLYDNDEIAYQTTTAAGCLSPAYAIMPVRHQIPPHKSYKLSVRESSNINVTSDKVTIVRIDGSRNIAYKTTYADGWYTAEVRDFGTFALMADTEPPTVGAINFKEQSPLKTKVLKVKIQDNLSGIETYHCYLNGTWILGEYDGKSNTLSIHVGGQLKAGRNELQVDVYDGCNNLTRKRFMLQH